MPRYRCLYLLLSIAAASTLTADDYPQFRGSGGDARSDTPLPVRWADVDGASQNIRWRIDVPGEGWSQPIVADGRVYLTTAVPVDPDVDAGPEAYRGGGGYNRDDLTDTVFDYTVLCLDADTGDQVWRTAVKRGKPPIPRHATNTYATETPVVDGGRVYAYFGMNGVHALTLDGAVVWQRDLGAYDMRGDWGTAGSPAVHDEKLFVQVDNEERSFLVALDVATGKDTWRIDRDERSHYSSPFVWRNSLRDELIVGGMVYRSHDPDTGDMLWTLDMNRGRSSATPVADGDRLFVGNELRRRGGPDDGGGRLYCVTPGGSGDITPPDDGDTGEFVAWRNDDSGIQMASPVITGGNLYFFQRRSGRVTCVDAATGRTEYQQRLKGAKAFWASPWTDGRNVYALESGGTTYVIAIGDDYRLVSRNVIDELSWGTPAIADGRIYLRTASRLYCIAE